MVDKSKEVVMIYKKDCPAVCKNCVHSFSNHEMGFLEDEKIVTMKCKLCDSCEGLLVTQYPDSQGKIIEYRMNSDIELRM